MDNKIIERIRKMFALATNNPNSHEADSAMRMASKLLDKHNLTMSDLATKEKVGIVIKEVSNMPWIRTTFMAISKLYDCEYIIDKSGSFAYHLIIGNESNRTTAEIVIEYVMEVIYKESKGKGNGFRNAMANGVYSNAMEILKARMADREEVIPGTGLVPVDISKGLREDNADWIRDNIGRTVKGKGTKCAFDASGVQAGKNINLGAQIGGSRMALAH